MVPIAGVPIVFLPELSVDLAVSGVVEGSIGGSAQYRVDTTSGFVYDENTGITQIKQATPSATAAWTAGAKATAELSVTPALAVYVFGAVGPKASVPFGVGVELDPCRTPLWKLGGSIKAKFGLSLSSWLGSFSLANVDITLVDSPITQGGTAIANFPGCDFQVTVVSHSFSVQSRTSARTEIGVPAYEISEDAHSSEFGQFAIPRFIERTRDTDNGVRTWFDVELGPYVPPTQFATARPEASEVDGASASANSAVSVDVRRVGDVWQFEADLNTRVEVDTLPDVWEGDLELWQIFGATATSLADARVEVVLAVTSELTVSGTCDVGDVLVLGGQVAAEGCISSLFLPPGSYTFSVGAGSQLGFRGETGQQSEDSSVVFSLSRDSGQT